MSLLRASAPLAGAILLAASALAGLHAALGTAARDFFIPSPETTAELFLHALESRRYEAAAGLLSRGARLEAEPFRLRDMMEALEARGEGVEEAHAAGGRSGLDAAAAVVAMRRADGRREAYLFRFVLEDRLWRIASLRRAPNAVREGNDLGR